MMLKLSHIYKDYQQEKLVVPVLKDEFFCGTGRIYSNHGTFRFRKNNADEYHRLSGSSHQRIL